MKIQEFNVGPRFIFGEDAISELSNLSIKKAYIVCDPYMAKSGMVHHVLDHLDQGTVETKIFSGVVPNPTVESIQKVFLKFEHLNQIPLLLWEEVLP